MSDGLRPILEMRDITKTFPGVKALSNVNLSVEDGEIHAVVGENGAGKSTLMKVLSGVYPHGTYDGDDRLSRARTCQFNGIHDSEHLGIVIIHQELALVPMLSIAENIFLGNEHATLRRHRLERDQQTRTERAAQEGRPQGGSQDADHQYRRRQAAAGRDRQGAQQGSASC